MSIGVKPCPFCGGNAVKAVCHKNPDNYDDAEFWVVCSKCHIKTNRYLDEDEPVELWNRRADDDTELLALFNGWLDSERYNCDNSEHD